jgi:hypothetical protein
MKKLNRLKVLVKYEYEDIGLCLSHVSHHMRRYSYEQSDHVNQ